MPGDDLAPGSGDEFTPGLMMSLHIGLMILPLGQVMSFPLASLHMGLMMILSLGLMMGFPLGLVMSSNSDPWSDHSGTILCTNQGTKLLDGDELVPVDQFTAVPVFPLACLDLDLD